MDTRPRTSPEQFAVLLEFMETHGDLTRPQKGVQGRVKADLLWENLSNLLNSVGGGVCREKEKWKKIWADWKTKTKKKAAIQRKNINCTGGGQSSSRLSLTPAECRILGIMGVTAVVGLSVIEERGFDVFISVPPLSTQDNITSEATLDPKGLSPVDMPLPPPPPAFADSAALASAEATSASRGAASPLRSENNTPPRRRPVRARRRLTPFQEAAAQFAAIEQQRFEQEERKLKLFQEFKMEVITSLKNIEQGINNLSLRRE